MNLASTSFGCVAVLGAAAAFASSAAHAQCSSSKNDRPMTAQLAAFGSTPDIVDTAVQNGSFKTLVAAVKAAGLVDALKGDGPFTVFAPTDEAFAKIPNHTLKSLLKPENKDQLTAILTYHVVPGTLTARDVTRLGASPTLNGQAIGFETDGSTVMVDGAKVLATDINCRNGIIHVIDTVIMPSKDDIVATAQSTGMFGTLLAAAEAAGLVVALKGKGPLTVLAPTDDAFAALPAGTVESLLRPANRHKLAEILKYHVISGRVFAADAVKAGAAATLQGDRVQFDIRDGRLFVDNAKLVATDVDASNGVVHVIDRVLIPAG